MTAGKKRDLEKTKPVPLGAALPLLDDLRLMIDETGKVLLLLSTPP